jgi:hypothetical protein
VPAKRRRLTKRALTGALAGSLVASGLLITAPAALANWTQQSTPNLGGIDAWDLKAVSCTAPNTCMAVGIESASTGGLLAERRTESGWSSVFIPEPHDNSQLFGVSCTTAKACTAVGFTPKGQGIIPLAERWNGSTWSAQTAPAPGRTSSSQLSAVVCTSAKSCLAVGDLEHGSTEAPLSELWTGTKWKVLATPKPSGRPTSTLTGLSCASASKCFAVGLSRDKNDISKTLAEIWNGKTWAIQKTPNGPGSSSLEGVSCASATTCMATGSGLAERWNGKAWSLLKIGKPQGTAADLSSVSCAKAGPCYAVGHHFTGGVEFAVAELWNGSRWSVQPVSIATSFDDSELAGVSCPTATNCTAVGAYDDSGNKALAEDFSLRWNITDAPFTGSDLVGVGLSAVSCISPQNCLAVGTFETTNSSFQTFSDHWDGTVWTPLFLPKPKSTNMDAISCPAANSCEAVGNFSTGASEVPQAERWNGARWTLQHAPAPAGADRAFLLGVSCATKTACVAVGFSIKSGKIRSLGEHWDGKTWKVTPTPNPAGQQTIQLNAVSCRSATFCLATGTFAEGTFAATWNGKSWGPTAPVPNAKGAIHASLSGVSCSTSKSCQAVGTSTAKQKTVPLAEHWDGRKWSPLTVPPPAGALDSNLNAISCVSGGACAAVGSVVRNKSRDAVAYAWTGKRWVIHQVAVPGGALSPMLTAVSCNSGTACMAVGDYTNPSNLEAILAEQYS